MLELTVEDLSVRYGSNLILDSICAKLMGGEMTAVIGKNGAGKTTLIKALAKQIKSTGKISICDGNTQYDDRCIAYVPQMGMCVARLTVFEMVLLGLVKNLHWKVPEEYVQKVNQMLQALGLTQLAARPFHELSGGQRQLVFLAQSFIARPKVLMLDEPTSALDMKHQLVVMDKVKEYTEKTGAITIFVVHDLILAARYSNYMLLLNENKIMKQGTPREVLLPKLLEEVYGVSVHVEENAIGQFSVIPQSPLSSVAG